MKSNYKRLGDYITLTDERNKNLTITNLQGVSINKEFIPSIANIIGTDLSSYKIVRNGQFAYGPVTSRNGDKISVALLNGDDCIISSSYTSFEITSNELLPEYLMLWFRRPEFDRYARFMSNGSAREIFDWSNMCNVMLPVPSMQEQEKIVHDYKVVVDRIELLKKINDNLEKILLINFRKNFEPLSFDLEPKYELSELMDFGNGYAFESSEYLPTGEYKIITIGNVEDGFLNTTKVNYLNNISKSILDNYLLLDGDIVISLTGNVGRTALVDEENLLLNQRVAKIVCSENCKCFLYALFRNDATKSFLEGISKGTAQLNLSPIELLKTKVNYDLEGIHCFSERLNDLLVQITTNSKQIKLLAKLKDNILSTLTKEV